MVGGHSGYKRPSLIFSNTSSSSPSGGGGASPGDMWSYVNGGTNTSTENQFQTAEKAGVMSRAIDLFALPSDSLMDVFHGCSELRLRATSWQSTSPERSPPAWIKSSSMQASGCKANHWRSYRRPWRMGSF
ncbi:unnamed protein product [Symbiodinium sp. CCMP2456]|nr:unnamed protein product [Symbiodinium sp. CCMP2456]